MPLLVISVLLIFSFAATPSIGTAFATTTITTSRSTVDSSSHGWVGWWIGGGGGGGSKGGSSGKVSSSGGTGGLPPPPPPPCIVSISAQTSQLSYNNNGVDGSLPRNNPDGTYYPGDAFLLSLSIGVKNRCTSTSVSITGGAGVSSACPSCQTSMIDISPSASPGTYTIKASVSGTGPGGNGFASTSIPVIVADPMITIKVTQVNVTDRDGYLMHNADGTYYINDAVALKYEVDYRFKNARYGVIEPEVTRIHPYPHIADLDCLRRGEGGKEQGRYCTLVVPATSATSQYSAEYAYATGISVANATAWQGLGPKTFQFDARLKNAGIYTGMHSIYRHTVSIVNYAPRFVAYPYLNLKEDDDDNTASAYGKKLMIGLHYLGSSDHNDDNNNNNDVIKPLRRAKLNFYTNEVRALVLGSKNTDVSKVVGLTWLSGKPIDNNNSSVIAVVTSQAGKSAMIECAGYFKVAMKMIAGSYNNPRPSSTQPPPAADDDHVFSTIQNVTALPAFYSKDFAGKHSLLLFTTKYTYPDNTQQQFANTISIRVLNGSSPLMHGLSVSLEIRPASSGTNTNTTTTICDYIGKHAQWSTGDAMFTKIALSDTYSCGPVSASSTTGTAMLHAKMTGLIIPKVYEILYPGGLQTIPPNIALESPASQILKVTVAGQSREYALPLYSFDQKNPIEIIVNIGANNVLYAVRNGNAVTVKSPVNFGPITNLQVTGVTVTTAAGLQSCNIDVCIINLPEAATIVASNEWGGKAQAIVPAPVQTDIASSIARVPNVLVVSNGQNVILALFVAIGAVIAGIAFKKYTSWVGQGF